MSERVGPNRFSPWSEPATDPGAAASRIGPGRIFGGYESNYEYTWRISKEHSMTLAKLNRTLLAMAVVSAGMALTGGIVKDSAGGMRLELKFGQSLAKDGDSSGRGGGGDSDGGGGGGDRGGDHGGGDRGGDDRGGDDRGGDDRGGDHRGGHDHDRDDRDDDRGRGRDRDDDRRHGQHDDDDDHRGRHGRDSRPSNLAEFFSLDRERGSVAKAESEGTALEVTYSDGWKEEVENGRYELKDPTNQTVVERAATQSDIDRLNSAF
jgi:hypothetical protein